MPAQIAYPIADTFLDGWTPSAGATAWEVLDDFDETDYIESSSTDNQVNMQLDTLDDPATDVDHILRFRIWRSTDLGPALIVGLWVGDPATVGVLIANVALSDAEIVSTETWETYELTLSGPEADSITDYTDLYVQITNGNPTTWRIGGVEFEVPELLAPASVPVSPWSHLKVNGEIRDYRWRYVIPWSRVMDATAEHARMEGGLQITWGQSQTSSHRIEFSISGEDDGATTTIIATFQAPEWMADIDLSSDISDGVEIIIEMIQGGLASVDCDNWSLIFESLHIYIDGVEFLVGGFAVLPASGGPYTDSGAGYDGTQNSPYAYGLAEAFDRDYAIAACNSGQADYELHSYGTWEAGWQHRKNSGYAWTSEPTALTTAVPPGTCDCSDSLPAISGADTWSISGYYELHDEYTIVDEGPRECPSDTMPPGPPVPYDVVLHAIRDIRVQLSGVRIDSRSAGILRTQRIGSSGCSDVGLVSFDDESSTTTTEPFTYCESDQTTRTLHAETYCVNSGGYLIVTCPQYWRCSWLGRAQVEHPELPPCTPAVGLGGVAVTQTPSEPRYVKATVDSDSNIVVQHAGFSIPAPSWIVETTVTDSADCGAPVLLHDPRMSEGLILLYECGADVHETRSHDLALTWDTAAVAFTGCSQPKARTGNRTIVRAAFKYDSGSSGPGKIVCTIEGEGDLAQSSEFYWADDAASLSVDDTGYDFCFAHDDQMRWTMSLTISGDSGTSDWWSTDECRTWTQVV